MNMSTTNSRWFLLGTLYGALLLWLWCTQTPLKAAERPKPEANREGDDTTNPEWWREGKQTA